MSHQQCAPGGRRALFMREVVAGVATPNQLAIRRRVHAVAALVLAMLFVLLAPAAPTHAAGGTITVTVVNKTTGASLNGAAVSLTSAKTPRQTFVTFEPDPSGIVRFSGIPLGPTYQVLVQYQGANYLSEPLRPSEAQPEMSAEIGVYEGTEDPAGLAIDRMTIVVGGVDAETQQASILEVLNVSNPTDRTYVGDRVPEPGVGLPPIHRRTLRLPLPSGTTEFVPRTGLRDGEVVPMVGGWASLTPVLPGQTEVSYSYQKGYAFGSLFVERKLPYHIRQLTVMVPDAGFGVASNVLKAGGVVNIEGRTYAVFNADNLPADKEIVFQVEGLPTPSPSLQVDPRVVQIVAALAVVALLSLVALRVQQHRKQRVATMGELVAAEERLVTRIAELDDRFAAGNLRESQYERQRSSLKHQLVAVLRARDSTAARMAVSGE